MHAWQKWLLFGSGALVLMLQMHWWHTLVMADVASFREGVAKQAALVAEELERSARCIELTAKFELPKGEPYALLRPGAGGGLDTVMTTMRDPGDPGAMIPCPPRFTLPAPAIVDVRVQMSLMAAKVIEDPAAPITDAGVRPAALATTVSEPLGGYELRLLDTAALRSMVIEHFLAEGEVRPAVVVNDSARGMVLYVQDCADTARAIQKGVRQHMILSVTGRPHLLSVYYPNELKAMALRSLPSLLLGLTALGLFVLMIHTTWKAALAKRRLAQMQLDMMSTMTHELNTPVANINLALDTLRRSPTSGSRVTDAQLLDLIQVENKRLQSKIRKVLDVSLLEGKQWSMDYERHDIHALIESCTQGFRLVLHQAGGRLEHRFEAQQPWVRMDRTYVSNAIEAILDNAVKYGGAGVLVCVTTVDVQNGVLISVSDTGPGIPRAERLLVFEKFYRVRSEDRYSIKGTGIGLFYAKQVVEAHGGSIRIAEQYGPGTSIEIFLPTNARMHDQVARG